MKPERKSSKIIIFGFLAIFIGGCQTAQRSTEVVCQAPDTRDPASNSCEPVFASANDLNPPVRTTDTRPIERWSKRFDSLRKALTGQNNQQIFDQITTEEARRDLLQLQGLARMYSEAVTDKRDSKRIEMIDEKFQEFEDAVGFVQRKHALYEHHKDSSLSSETKDYLKKMVEKADNDFFDYLKSKDWIGKHGPTELDHLVKEIGKVEFQGSKKDLRAQAKALLNMVKINRKKIATLDKIFAKEDYQEADLEAGPHHMRRLIRWTSIVLQSIDGAFKYSTAPDSSAERQQLEQLYGKTKYQTLSSRSIGD
jgi:hypothetical protein